MSVPPEKLDRLCAKPAGPFPADVLVRSAGFVIHSRPATGKTLWRSNTGTVVTHAEAVECARVILRKRQEGAKDAIALGNS